MPPTRQSADMTIEEKIAIFLASMDEQTAAAVLQQLEPEVMARLVTVIRDLGVVPGKIRDLVMQNCLREIHELGQAVFGDKKLASSLLVKAIGEKRASALLSDDNIRKEMPFVDLRMADPEEMANTFMKEQPIVTALVLRYLPANIASDVLRRFPGEYRKLVVMNLTTSNMVPSDDVIAAIEE
ncbi:MAG: hypothetical protein HY343_06245, partial [Lentisphaerae bacterium]|nr:hypothetical protein [Lentisphaerota bacterium]